MNINKASGNAHLQKSTVKTPKSEAQDSGKTITINVGSVGDVFEKGAKVAAGAVTSAVYLPRTVLAPTFASFTGNNVKNVKFAEALTVFGATTVGGGAAGVAVADSLGTDLFGKIIFGGVGALIGAGIGAPIAEAIESSSLPVFNYDNIFEARDKAREAIDGSEAAKRGAAFAAGYGTAAKEGFQVGGKAVDGVVEFVKGGAEFVAGMGKAVTGS